MLTLQKGNLAVAKIVARCLELSLVVSLPFGEGGRYDLVLDKGDDRLYRVQVKTGRLRKGVVIFNICSLNGRVGNFSARHYTSKEIDAFMVYCSELDKCYFIPMELLTNNKGSISLRHEEAKNGQTKHVKQAKDFEF